ncbi:BREX system P-loop protein BrxC [Nostoc sp.]|uniref:BREX system P-loop protein BrxC n=1 Tax=Nostoc sp. TaxID=1180 RepID=UPI002FF644F4
MKISGLFQKDIYRNINGVIKVGQQDIDNVRQELEEYVVTKELDKHFRTFFERYTQALNNPTDKMGVWISGFFGSGKSHFLKILSYLLANQQMGNKRALDYFDDVRIPDAMLRASIAQAANNSCDVILFNIDSKAEASSKNDKESIVKVFQKVFDEYLGYFGTVPAIAEFERQLDKQGKYEAFQQAFLAESGLEWKENRDAWGFYQDAIITALQTSIGMSAEAASKLLEFNEQSYSLSVDRFSTQVKEHLNKKGKQHRLIFMVDEVGQYIGENPDLMLNMQTVVEDLGIQCQGKAWVVVTSQEAMDEITQNRIKEQDFSKIIGRFYRPLSLSSANTDEVIKLRLLAKNDAAREDLEILYNQKFAILKNQINFSQDSAELPGYGNAEDFIASYPFIPYQFNLLQKVFTQIRVMGSAGKHLASGERSLLDAFQVASKEISNSSLGVLVPFHTFYMAVDGFLDSVISQVIVQGEENSQLQKPFDINLLKTLFLIKYVKEIRANVDNLITLSISNIDQDRLTLKEDVEKSLERLEKQTLIQRNGDIYEFLTYEEQDIGREIKNTQFEPNKVTNELQNLVWDAIFTDKLFRKDSRHQYQFNRKLDEQLRTSKSDITLHIITPYAEAYGAMQDENYCMVSTVSGDEVLVRLPDDKHLVDELNTLIKTAEYLRLKNSSNLTPSIQSILRSRGDENTKRREQIQVKLKDLIARATVFACGSKVEISNRDSKNILIEGLTYLVDNIYKKLGYVASGFETEDQVANAFTRDSQELDTNSQPVNNAAHSDMQNWLWEETRVYRQVTIRTLIDKFAVRPYGWSELDTLGIMAELANKGLVELRHAQNSVNLQENGLVSKLRSKKGLDEYTVRLAETIDSVSLTIAKNMASELLDKNPPSDPQLLFTAYQEAFNDRRQKLQEWLQTVENNVGDNLPFANLLRSNLQILDDLLAKDSAAEFYRTFRARKDEIEEYIEDVQKLHSFFTAQIKMFLKASNDLKTLEPQLRHISDQDILKRVSSAKQILAMPDPTAKIPELAILLKPVQEKVQEVLQSQIAQVQTKAKTMREDVGKYITSAYGDVSTELDIASITREVDNVVNAVSQVANIDSVIARQSELEGIKTQIFQTVDAQAIAIIQNRVNLDNNENQPVVKPIVPVKVREIASKNLLETEQDVEDYLAVLRSTLIEKIQRNNRIRLE